MGRLLKFKPKAKAEKVKRVAKAKGKGKAQMEVTSNAGAEMAKAVRNMFTDAEIAQIHRELDNDTDVDD